MYSADWVNASPNTTIESAKQNAMVTDLVTDANATRPITAGGTGGATAAAARTALAVPGLATENVFTKTQIWAKGADVASDAALPIIDDGNYFDVTGTNAITSIATVGVGAVIKLHFDGILTLTHHATDLILPGLANITTAAGDEAEFTEYATGDWRCTNYQRAGTSPTNGWETVAGSGAFSAETAVDSTSLSNYVRLRISLWASFSDDGVSLIFRTRTGSVDTGATDYDYNYVYAQGGGAPATLGPSTGSSVPLTVGTAGNDVNEAVHVTIEIEQFNKTTYAWARVSSSETSTANVLSILSGEFRRRSIVARTGFTIAPTAGTFSGTILVEGMRG